LFGVASENLDLINYYCYSVGVCVGSVVGCVGQIGA
jgi:hypothetical protein